MARSWRAWPHALLWVLLVIPLGVEGFTDEGQVRRWAELAVGGLLLGVAVVSHHRQPLVALSVPVAAAMVSALVLAPTAANPDRLWPFLASGVFGYLAGRRVRGARPVWYSLAAIILAGLPVSVMVDQVTRGGFGLLFGLYDWFVTVLILLFTVVLPWLVGRYRRQRAELVSAGWERAALLERQRRLEADRARLRERARIAQDMHDSLGHEWALIALRAAALEVSAELDEGTRASAKELRAGVAAATERLREIIGVLRPDSDPGPEERVDLAALVDRAVAAGMTVHWDRAGEPVGLPPMVDRAVHRVVQEAITNAAKHAPGTAVTVRLEHGPDRTTVSVTNGQPTGQAGETDGGGHGLVGLRERISLLGGTLRAGPRDGGFEVVAELPHSARPTDVSDVPEGRPGSEGTESAQHLRHARGRVRRSLVDVIRVPLIAGATVIVLASALYFAVGAANRLDPAVYDRLRIGADREDVESELPPFQILGDPERMLPAPPSGTVCQHYWSGEQTDERLFFRLCFAADRLVGKEIIPRSAISRHGSAEDG